MLALAITVVVLLIVTIVGLGIGWYVISRRVPGVDDGIIPDGLDYTCLDDSECGDGLMCIRPYDELPGKCKRGIGSRCSNVIECEPEAKLCIGVCAVSSHGGLNQECDENIPCGDGLICLDSEPRRCKLRHYAQGCWSDSDCHEGRCVDKVCSPMYHNGQLCSNNLECLSGNCSQGVCQREGIRTGDTSSICILPRGEYGRCDDDLVCHTNLAIDPSRGVCTDITSEDGLCLGNIGCKPPDICYDGRCVLPRDNENYQTNSCEITGVCSYGFSCQGGICLPGDGVPNSNGSVFSLLEWKGDRWQAVRRDIPSPGPSSRLSSISTDKGMLHLYLGGLGYNVINEHGLFPLDVNIDIVLIQTMEFTPGGKIVISYLDIQRGALLDIQDIPESWHTTNPRLVAGAILYGEASYSATVDDRFDKLRVAFPNIGSIRVAGRNSKGEEGADRVHYIDHPVPIDWVNFYSDTPLSSELELRKYLYHPRGGPVLIDGETRPLLPKSSLECQMDRISMYTPPGTGTDLIIALYTSRCGKSGKRELRLYNGRDSRLPGTFDDNTIPSVTVQNGSLGIFVLTRTS